MQTLKKEWGSKEKLQQLGKGWASIQVELEGRKSKQVLLGGGQKVFTLSISNIVGAIFPKDHRQILQDK